MIKSIEESSTQEKETLRKAAQTMSRPSILMRTLIAARANLNAVDAECLDYLLDTMSGSASDLVAATGLRKSSVTSLIDRLEAAKYVTRTTDPSDKRKVLIAPQTERIYSHFGALYSPITEGFNAIIAPYSKSEIAFLTNHYNQMTALYERQVELLRDPEYRGKK